MVGRNLQYFEAATDLEVFLMRRVLAMVETQKTTDILLKDYLGLADVKD